MIDKQAVLDSAIQLSRELAETDPEFDDKTVEELSAEYKKEQEAGTYRPRMSSEQNADQMQMAEAVAEIVMNSYPEVPSFGKLFLMQAMLMGLNIGIVCGRKDDMETLNEFENGSENVPS